MTLCESCSTPLPDTEGVVRQSFTIEGWHPANFQSSGHGGRASQWRASRERKEAWAAGREAAKAAGWVPVTGKALIEVTYVYAANYRTDKDNLTTRLKGLLDGLKTIKKGKYAQAGWIVDDDTEHLDLRVRKVVAKGRKALIVHLYGQLATEGTECSPTYTTYGTDTPPLGLDAMSVWTARPTNASMAPGSRTSRCRHRGAQATSGTRASPRSAATRSITSSTVSMRKSTT